MHVTKPAILVVDDSRANQLAFELVLESLGHPVVKASSGEEALRLLLQDDFAVLVLDVQMPGMTGFELATLLKTNPRHADIPILFVTGVSRDVSDVIEGYSRGAVDYLIKPVDPELLRAKVRVFLDLHARRAKSRAHTTQRIRLLLDSMPLPLWGLESDGSIYTCNRSWTEYSGLTADDTGRLGQAHFVHVDDRARVADHWSEGRRSGQPFDVEARLRSREGAYRWHLVRAIPDESQGDPEGRWIVTATDIHERKIVEEERARLLVREQHAREQAESANRSKDEFLATVSHELRTPLNAILGWCRMIDAGMLDPERTAQAVKTIERSGLALARLVNDILDVSRIVTGKFRLQMAQVDLVSIVGDALETIRPTAQAKGIDLRWTPPESGEVGMLGDTSRLQQIVWNLLSNAVKFTPAGGRVELRMTCGGDSAELVVEDDGAGIDPAFLPYVFDRFRQADATTTRSQEGLGLGLAIVRQLVELHGGAIAADSEGPGRGARFTVRLPAGTGAQATATPVPASPFVRPVSEVPPYQTLSRLDGHSIFYVDDRSEARELVVAALSGCGATVAAFATASSALEAMREGAPDVLISDIGMPQEDGYSLIRRVRALPPHAGGNVPAIALTAYARPEDRLRTRNEGFQVHLAKPVAPAELVATVASLLAHPARRIDSVRPATGAAPVYAER